MDPHSGIRQIFTPESNFEPDQFDDQTLEAYDEVQRRMIATGESWERVEIPVGDGAGFKGILNLFTGT